MASHSHDHGDDHAHGETEPVTDQNHDNSWSANLEKPQYEDDLSLLKRHGIEAVEHTTSGHHVNLVTHKAHGHPEGFSTMRLMIGLEMRTSSGNISSSAAAVVMSSAFTLTDRRESETTLRIGKSSSRPITRTARGLSCQPATTRRQLILSGRSMAPPSFGPTLEPQSEIATDLLRTTRLGISFPLHRFRLPTALRTLLNPGFRRDSVVCLPHRLDGTVRRPILAD